MLLPASAPGHRLPRAASLQQNGVSERGGKTASRRHTTVEPYRFLALKPEHPAGHPLLPSEPSGSPASSRCARILRAAPAPPAQCGCAGRCLPCAAPTCPATPGLARPCVRTLSWVGKQPLPQRCPLGARPCTHGRGDTENSLKSLVTPHQLPSAAAMHEQQRYEGFAMQPSPGVAVLCNARRRLHGKTFGAVKPGGKHGLYGPQGGIGLCSWGSRESLSWKPGAKLQPDEETQNQGGEHKSPSGSGRCGFWKTFPLRKRCTSPKELGREAAEPRSPPCRNTQTTPRSERGMKGAQGALYHHRLRDTSRSPRTPRGSSGGQK
ncbi:uncharacterized protein LOC110401967 isoform X2 [Numida meleagris]|uniref:uncharacterized protein LOC110401967 isoform X2 n=1 Tax=Numida meleagris TaxID=8996 RepID=UPI000B3D8D56|nr:uncharacterized protein LOC110401967 isoform X2 [Numida meleagris]